MATYLRPHSIAEATAALEADVAIVPNDRLTILAGATDFFPSETTRQAWFHPTPRNILDISAIAALHGIAQDETHLRIGALATWSELLKYPLPAAFDGLKQASRQVGGVQIQNRGTLIGNICNASPAADGVPPLLALDASVEIASMHGLRQMPLNAFVLGNRKTALQKGEMVTAILVPMAAESEKSVFLKLGSRCYLVISIVSVAANIALNQEGRIEVARIAVGACSAVPQRLSLLEKSLIGTKPEYAGEFFNQEMLSDLNPIDDVRASASYRMAAAFTLVDRALDALAHPQRYAA